MFSTDLVSFLQSGCSLIVGTVSASGEPRASRGWACDVIDAMSGRVRVLVGSDDSLVLEHLVTTGAIAVTGADVLTLRSAQLKGSVVSIHPVSAADRERSARYCDEFFDAVSVVDDIPRALMERLVPADMVACEIIAQHVFDQTPGPSAGSVMGSSEP